MAITAVRLEMWGFGDETQHKLHSQFPKKHIFKSYLEHDLDIQKHVTCFKTDNLGAPKKLVKFKVNHSLSALMCLDQGTVRTPRHGEWHGHADSIEQQEDAHRGNPWTSSTTMGN